MARKKKLPLIEDFDNIPEEALVPADEQPYEIPDHWKWVKLGSISNLISGRDEPLADCNAEGVGVPYVVGASNIHEDQLFIERWIEDPKVLSRSGDLLISVKGTIGKLYVQREPELNLSRQIMALDPHNLLNVEFLRFVMEINIALIQSRAVGLIPGISRQVLLDMAVPLPPLEEQERIVEKLEARLTQIDDAIERTEAVLVDVDRQMANLVRAAVSGRLTREWLENHKVSLVEIGPVKTAGVPEKLQKKPPSRKKKLPLIEDFNDIPEEALVPRNEQPYEIPENWKWVWPLTVFSDCTDSKRKLKKKSYLEVGSFPVIDQGQTFVGGYSEDSELLQRADLPLVVFGDHTRVAKLVRFPFIQGADGTKVLKAHKILKPEYLFYWLRSEPVENLGYRRHFTRLKKTPFPLPSFEEQEQIVRQLDSCVERINTAKSSLEASLDKLRELRSSTVSASVAGRL